MAEIPDDSTSGSESPTDEAMKDRQRENAPERRATTSEEAQETGVSVSVVFGILADQRQRYALYNLIEQDGQAKFSDLATQLAAAENRTSVELATEEMTTRVRAGLYHADLPKLEDYGFVEFDRETGLVTLTEKADEIDQHLQLARDMENGTNEYLEFLDRENAGMGGAERRD